MTMVATHPQVPHPRDMVTQSYPYRHRSLFTRISSRAAGKVAGLFGATAIVWIFMVVPLAALLFPSAIQAVVFFLASGWIQLWALPLLTYIGNEAEVARSAKADADHLALTSMHTGVDAIAAMLAVMDTRLAVIEAHLGLATPDASGGTGHP